MMAKPRKKTGSLSEERILAAARALFLEVGYDGASLERIAELAGVSRQTLYNRFTNKETIFRSVIDRHWAALALLSEAPGEALAEDCSAERYLASVAEKIASFVAEHDQADFVRLVIAESRHMPWISETFFRSGKEPMLANVVAGLAELDRRGRLSVAHPEIAAKQFLGMVQEFVIWPQVMDIGEGLKRLPPNDVVISEAIATFMARYGRRDPGPGGA